MSDITTTNASNDHASAGADDARHSISAYVSDLLALEQHIGQPLKGQLDSDATAKFPSAVRLIQTLQTQNQTHVTALEQCLKQLGGNAASPVKSAWATLLGGAAAAIGGSRKTKVTKWLRDDYTALSLAGMSYTLLHSTAVGLGDTTVAALARQGLADYAKTVVSINQIVPEVVLGELAQDGETVAAGAADTIRDQTNSIWRNQSEAAKN